MASFLSLSLSLSPWLVFLCHRCLLQVLFWPPSLPSPGLPWLVISTLFFSFSYWIFQPIFIDRKFSLIVGRSYHYCRVITGHQSGFQIKAFHHPGYVFICVYLRNPWNINRKQLFRVCYSTVPTLRTHNLHGHFNPKSANGASAKGVAKGGHETHHAQLHILLDMLPKTTLTVCLRLPVRFLRYD